MPKSWFGSEVCGFINRCGRAIAHDRCLQKLHKVPVVVINRRWLMLLPHLHVLGLGNMLMLMPVSACHVVTLGWVCRGILLICRVRLIMSCALLEYLVLG